MESPNEAESQEECIRILQVFEPGMDGVFRHVESLTDYLISRKHWAVAVAYSSHRSSDSLFAFIERVKASGGPVIDLATGSSPSPRDLRSLWRLSRLIRQFRPHIIHAHSSKAGGLTRLPFVSAGIPVVYTPNGYYGLGRRPGIKARLFNQIEKLLASRALTIHVSPEEDLFAATVLKATGKKSQLVSNAVDFERFKPASMSERNRVRSAFGIPTEAWVIGSIGRLGFQKDPETLYRSFARLIKKLPRQPIWLMHVFGGSSKEVAAIQEFSKELGIDNRLSLPGYQAAPKQLYHAMDAFCLSSRYEGLPLTAIEALACDLPLILTDGPGLRSFGNKEYDFNKVYYGHVEDPESLADAMELCLQSNSQTSNHRYKAHSNFSIATCYSKIESIYRQEVYR